jgi:hypothetical protein
VRPSLPTSFSKGTKSQTTATSIGVCAMDARICSAIGYGLTEASPARRLVVRMGQPSQPHPTGGWHIARYAGCT